MPDKKETRADLSHVLDIVRLPTDIVLSADGAVTFVGGGPGSLRAAWRWVKYHDSAVDGLANAK